GWVGIPSSPPHTIHHVRPNPQNNYFLVVAHDQPDAGARRAKHVQEHMAYNQPFAENGRVVAGGGLLPDGANASDADVHGKIVGSYIVFQADTAEQVWDSLKKDVFYASGEVVGARATSFRGWQQGADSVIVPGVYVQWDHSRIAVTPVFSAFPRVE
ncbi:hypothetical protein V8D89_001219, partial [Ganoderma adspersum]